MLGNVAEYVLDTQIARYSEGPIQNPLFAPPRDGNPYGVHVVRGSEIRFVAGRARASVRTTYHHGHNYIGFRVVKMGPPPD